MSNPLKEQKKELKSGKDAPKIILYQFEECPFCAKVRSFLREMELPFTTINAPANRDDPLRKELFLKSGVSTVPVIKIEGKYIGDSSKIIQYLQEKYLSQKKTP